MSDVPPTTVPPAPPAPAPKRKAFLIVTAALFVGWLGWLGATALTKSHEPIVSRAQAAAASVPVRAELTAAGDKPAVLVTVKERLTPTGPEPGTIGVTNLAECAGYTGPGEYLLLLARDGDATIDGRPAYRLVGQQRSPGADLEGVGPPMIYKWGDDVAQQAKRLFR